MESRTYPEIREEILARIRADPMTLKDLLSKMKDDESLVRDIVLHMSSRKELVFGPDGYKLTIGTVKEVKE